MGELGEFVDVAFHAHRCSLKLGQAFVDVRLTSPSSPTLQDKFTARAMCHRARCIRVCHARPRCATSAGKQVELDFTGSETELDNKHQFGKIPTRSSISCAFRSRTASKTSPSAAPLENLSRQGFPARLSPGNHIYIEAKTTRRHRFRACEAQSSKRGLVSHRTADRLTDRDFREISVQSAFHGPAKTELAGRGSPGRSSANLTCSRRDRTSSTAAKEKFTLKVPLTLIISPALFIRCGGTTSRYPYWLVGTKKYVARATRKIRAVQALRLPRVASGSVTQGKSSAWIP